MSLRSHKTKIVATIGPASSSPTVMESMIRAGMDIARLNFSHGDFSGHALVIRDLRAAAATVGRRLTIFADLPGPKMRIGEVDAPFELEAGDRFVLTTEPIVGNRERVSVSFDRLPEVVKAGDALYLNDGYVQLQVEAVNGSEVLCTVTAGGELRSRKGLNLPGIDLGIRAFTEHDRDCLAFALEHGVDAVSQSFVERGSDIEAVREAAHALGHHPLVIAKIERAGALDHLEEILDAADAVMIARGDLGVEVPIERIAAVQKEIMRRANRRAKPVITATQMLESMVEHRLPTRAEATDVANAILDGTDCVMLSAESAAGRYPVESVAMLAKIATAIEPTRRPVRVRELFGGFDLRAVLKDAAELSMARHREGTTVESYETSVDPTAHARVLPEHLLALSVEACFEYVTPAAVFTPTRSGDSARRMAMLHLPVWTIAVSPVAQTCQRLQLSYGVFPEHEPDDPESWNDYVREWRRRRDIAAGVIVLTAGPSLAHPEANHRLELIEPE